MTADLRRIAVNVAKMPQMIRGYSIMPDPGRFIAWSKQEQGTLLQQLELLESGKVRTGEDQGDGWVDTTDQSISRIKKRLAELEELLTEAGSGTASKPGER